MSSSRDPDATRPANPSDRPEDEVPIGMERLLGLAAVNSALAEQLARDPAHLADECGIRLQATELRLLQATPKSALRRMLTGIRTGLAEPERREFMQRAALAVGALMTAGAAGSGCKKTTPDSGKPSGNDDPMDSPPDPPATATPDAAQPPPRPTPQPDAGVKPRVRPNYTDQIRRAISPQRRRPITPPATGTGVRPK